MPRFGDLEGWRALYDSVEAANKEDNEQAVKRTGVSVTEAIFGGVPVLDIRPGDWKDNHKVLVYTHGGGYTLLSARSTLGSSSVMSAATGLRVISVDYTTAPFAKWREIQEQVISVFMALLADGYRMRDIALYGESAGGGLAISTVLNLRDRGIGLPAAVVLRSPWADLTNEGDTAHTLKDADPMLSYLGNLENNALAFADGLDLNDPRISPLYADFSKGFSPSLIIDGTKCIFLSTSVRMYQALEQAGQETKLDIYEGMWHAFQLIPVPESEVSIEKSAAFINKHLQ
jgi:acetyl esterase/lipase